MTIQKQNKDDCKGCPECENLDTEQCDDCKKTREKIIDIDEMDPSLEHDGEKDEIIDDQTKKHNWLKLSDGDRIYIMNAGLVMFWPFLTTLFKKLNYVEKGAFIDEEQAYKAIYLLQYLTDQNLDAPEHLLVLNKILCEALYFCEST